jgi:exonuclease SbcC
MIPLKLQLKNFLSYGSELQTVNFEPYNLICLSGKNGHGKSALLDAMCWAVWGEARKVSAASKPDMGLLRLGQRNMKVVFDFEFNQRRYRIRREFSFSYNKAYAVLEFGLINTQNIPETQSNLNNLDSQDTKINQNSQETQDNLSSQDYSGQDISTQDTQNSPAKLDNSEFIPLTEKTIKATQEKIEATLGLNFDAFVNSAFLRQGHSNEFSKKSPGERKQILGAILGISKYENLRKLALEKIRLAEADKSALVKLQQHWEAELAKLPEIQANFTQTKSELKLLVVQEQNLSLEKQACTIKLAELNSLQLDYQQKFNKFLEIRTAWRQAHKLQLNLAQLKQDPEKLLAQQKVLQQQLAAYQLAQQQELQLREQLLQLRSQTQSSLNQQQLQLEQLKAQSLQSQQSLTQLEQQQAKLKLEQAQLEITINTQVSFINLNGIITSEFKLFERKFERRKELYQQLISQGNFCQNKLANLKAQADINYGLSKISQGELALTNLRVENSRNVSREQTVHCARNLVCDLCEQVIAVDQQAILNLKLQVRVQNLQQVIQQIAQLLKIIKTQLMTQHTELQAQLKIRETVAIAQANLIDLQAKSEIMQVQQVNLITEYNTSKLTTNELLAQLEQAQILFTQAQQKFDLAVTRLEQAVQVLNYNPEQQIKLTQELAQLTQLLPQLQNLQTEQNLQQQRLAEISNLIKHLKQLNHQLKLLIPVVEQVARLEQELASLAERKLVLVQLLGGLENQQTKLLQLQVQHQAQVKQLASLDLDLLDYKEIALALGKDGIQALLIEEAVPEIEREANILLAKLTDNQMQLTIESLRDLKKGGSKETLDIKISDSMGIRPYEMFSGGEAFRIDFALRIAISKLLVQRAGTSLQTLMIDEGFGSQDEEGLGYVMDAIYKIQDDFAKIIIVSHLSAIKNQFPVHFMVEKGATGSQITVLHQA